MTLRNIIVIIGLFIAQTLGATPPAWALSANKVWMEFRPNGRYRIYVNYTIPALKSMREVYVDFSEKKAAERYYFDLVRGADFFIPDPGDRGFAGSSARGPDPW